MFTEHTKVKDTMFTNHPQPGITESEEYKADDNTANHSTPNDIKEIVTETNYFDNNRQFEYNMDVESLW